MRSVLWVIVLFPALLLIIGCGGGVTASSSSSPSPSPSPASTPVAGAEHPALLAVVIPGTIHSGETATLFWTAENADSIRIENGIGTYTDAQGTVEVSPSGTTTYDFVAAGAGGTTTVSLTLSVAQ